jgi:gamma-glutamyltranspeptidase/glutathione hydrolase
MSVTSVRKSGVLPRRGLPNLTRKLCQLGGASLLAAVFAGCGGGIGEGEDVPDVEILDLVAADEPRAALIGRDILLQGGNAADAAVAMALAMTVTLPSRVGLGGGGICLVHDPEADLVEAWDFLPRGTAADGTPDAGQAAAPGMLRGLFALHGGYGELRWPQLVAPAANLARFGTRVSRALAADLAAVTDPEAPALAPWRGPDGALLAEAERFSRPAYADTLSRLRGGNIGLFYRGGIGDAYAAAVAEAGLALDRDAVSAFRPQRQASLAVELGRDRLHFAPPPEAAGPALAESWPVLEDRDFEDLSQSQRLALLAEGLSGLGRAVPGASVVAMSADETAVACGFTQGGLFGTGEMAGDLGVPIAAALPPDRPAHGGVAILVNRPLTRSLLAAAGADSPAALLTPLAERLLAEATPVDAMAAPRPGEPASDAGRGLMIDCVWNRAEFKTCRAEEDPRGHGLAAAVGG